MAGAANVWLGLGSNLEQPRQQLLNSLAWLKSHSAIKLEGVSPVYLSPAMVLPGVDATAVADYLNMVVNVKTTLAPTALLQAIKQQEQAQGRDLSAKRWSSRPIDIDILMYDQIVLSSEQLTLPHPGIAERDFVLLPWRDLSANTVIPSLGTVADCAAALNDISAKLVDKQFAAQIVNTE